ncbi:MAG: zinc ribbon domain-containing protein, partial [Ktedonobacteraceae bacterium]
MDTCTTCGLELLPQARFCRKCGTPSHLLTPSNELHSMLTIPTDVSAAETFISNRRTPFPPTTPLPTIGPNVQGELGHIQSHPNEAEQEYRNRQIGLIGLGLVAGAEAVPLPHLPTIQGVPQPSTIPTLQGTPSMPGNAAPAHFPATGANHFAPGHTAQPGYIPGHAAHTGHVAQAGHAGQAVAAKAAGGLATKWIVIIIITTAVVVTASGGGALAYVLTRPQPVISISSTYTIGSIPVGSYGTILHISGQKFSNHSAITILLDGQIAPSAPNVVSDQHGSISADIPITAAWPLGQHILTARDADNYASKIGIQVEVV